LRHAFFLVVVVIAVLFIRHTGGLSLGKMFDTVAPAPTPTTTAPAGGSATYQHLEVRH
jgi:hypothetical protein